VQKSLTTLDRAVADSVEATLRRFTVRDVLTGALEPTPTLDA
jgi:hypothetical protein